MLNHTTRHDFHTLLDAVTLRDPSDAPAIIYVETGGEPRTITRRDFADGVTAYARRLADVGIGARDLLIIAHIQSLESIFAFWGALYLGAIPSMFPTLTEKLDPTRYAESMEKLVAHSGAKAVLTSPDFAAALRVSVPVLAFTDNPGMAAAPLPPYQASAEEIAFLQHSSGTTGLQKGVALSHEAVLNQLAHYSQTLNLNEADVVVSWLPLYHDMGLIAGFLLPLIQGIPLVLMSPFDWVKHPAMLLRAIDTYQGTLCWLPNFAYNHCARRIRQRDTEGVSLASMRAFINCSEPVREDSHRLFYERFKDNGLTPSMLAVSYAMAENTFAVTQTPIGQPAQLDSINREALAGERLALPESDPALAAIQVSCGGAIPGTAIQILAESGDTLPDRVVGEVAIRSDCMLTGYYNRPDLNDGLLTDGWYRTGDMGYMAEGEVYIVGRKKDLIISGGKNVYPGDLEAIVNGVAGVHPGRAVVFGVPDAREGTELIAVVAEVDTGEPDARQEIGAAIRAAIAADSTVTASFVHLVEAGWLIKTSSGKIARAANRDKWLATREAE